MTNARPRVKYESSSIASSPGTLSKLIATGSVDCLFDVNRIQLKSGELTTCSVGTRALLLPLSCSQDSLETKSYNPACRMY